MAQVSLSNINMSFLKEQYNITGGISFSDLYNYNTDISIYNELSLSGLIGKYRTFLPTDIYGIINWYDATSLILENIKNGSKISFVKDLSGNNNNATQNIIDNQPIFQKYGLNGKPSIEFIDKTLTNSKFLNFTSSSTPTEITIAVVFNTSTTNNNNIFSTATWSTGNILFEHNINKNPNIKINTITNNENTIDSIITLDYLPYLYIIKYYIDSNDGNTKTQLRYNGKNTDIYIHDNSLTNLILDNMTLGGTSLGGYTTNLHGNISEFILYNRLLSNDEIYILEGYLASKWWGVPSFLLPSTHKYYNISVLNTLNSPSLLYTFENTTHTSNVNILRNYGLEGNLLDGIVKNFGYSIQSLYYNGFNNHINSLFIWYKFDSTGNLIYENNGFGGSIYNLINPIGKLSNTTDYIKGNGSLKLLSTEISTTNKVTNLINFNSFSYEYTFSFWYKVVALNTTSDTLLSLSGAPNIGSEFYIQRENTKNNLIISIPNKIEIIRINNSIFNDGKWRHLSISLKKINISDLIISVYLNGIIQYNNHIINNAWFKNATNYLVINQYATGTGIYSGYGGNMLYDDFRIYTKYLNEKETQAIMGYPITLQDGIRNKNSYIWNTYNTFITPVIDIDYTSFVNYFFVDGNTYSISYNLQILNDALYTNDFELTIIHCNDINLDKLKIVHRFSNSSTDYIKIIINDTTTNNVTQYFENTFDNKLHNYVFVIPISLIGPNTITLYTDGNLTNAVSVLSLEPTIPNKFLKLGLYYNGISTLNTSPMRLEDFKIYSRELQLNEIHYINSNYNINKELSYYESNIFPFNFIKFTNSYAESNAYGPTYSNLIINYSSNGSWIFDLDYFNSYNGIQQFTVPQSGYYKITAAGAAGGSSYTETNYGKGIVVTNTTYLNANDILNILVGQKGGNGKFIVRKNDHDLHGQGGGGGGSFVALSNIPILIAGGGGGSGETIKGGENAIGVNAVNTTYSSSDSGNYSIRAIKGNGGEIGIYGASRGSGCGGGGFYTDGKNKISVYGGEYKGISYLNYLNNSNIGKPFNLNVGGIGGFPGGATGGTNYSLDLVWGGGGGSGYSGGPGGSASYFQGQTLGGGGGGSFDISGIYNHATINKQEGIQGYNSGNGYVKLQFLTSDHFLEYTNANNNINRNGLTLLIEPHNSYSYNSLELPTAMTNLVDGTYAYLNDNYYFNTTNNSIRLFNTSQYEHMNLSYLHINSHSEIRSLSIWYNVLSVPIDNTFLLETFENNGYINKDYVGADWFNSLRNIGSDEGGIMYVNSSNEIKNINWNDIIYPLNTWRNITLISHSNLTNDLSLFANKKGSGGMNVEIGPIMVYNTELSLNQHLANYNIYGRIYNTPYEFFFIGLYQYFIVPDNVYSIKVKMWGSGGGSSRQISGNGYGGSGSYVETILNVIPREKLIITVPSGGFAGLQTSRSSGGWPNGSTGGYESGGGGGFTSIQKENGEYMVIAASGAGSGYFYGTYDIINTVSYVQSQTCGAGGGDATSGNSPTIESGNPGTFNSGGLAYTTLFNNTIAADNGGYLLAGNGGTNFGGGGGNGLYGGSGGGERQDFVAGGSSGSSYCNPLYCLSSTIIAGNNGNVSNGEAPNNTDIDYPGSQIGDGGSAGGNNGRNGYVLIKIFY